MMMKGAFYVQDTGNPDNSADNQLQQLRAQTAGEEAQSTSGKEPHFDPTSERR